MTKAGGGQHRDVAAINCVRGCTHSLCQEALKIRLNRSVFVGHDIPVWLRLPGDARCIPGKEIGSRGIVGRPDKLLLLLREVSREAHDALRTHPDAPVRDFDVLEHVGHRELLLLALRSFVRVRRKRGDVDESGDAAISSCGRNDASTVKSQVSRQRPRWHGAWTAGWKTEARLL